MYLKKTLILCMLFLVSFINSLNAKQVTFTGIVVDSENRPVADARAVLYDIRYEDLEYSYSMEQVGEETSDADGEFSFTLEVETGEYS